VPRSGAALICTAAMPRQQEIADSLSKLAAKELEGSRKASPKGRARQQSGTQRARKGNEAS